MYTSRTIIHDLFELNQVMKWGEKERALNKCVHVCVHACVYNGPPSAKSSRNCGVWEVLMYATLPLFLKRLLPMDDL